MKRDHVILCGTTYLQSDDHLTDPQWTDLARATLHSKGWCDKYAREQLKLGKTVEVVPIGFAIEHERRVGLEKVKTTWLYRFEDAVRAAYGDYPSAGLWANAHMYYDMGLTVADACERFGKS
jgi:hypothetical protein